MLNFKKIKNKSGFTLVELMISMAVFSLIMISIMSAVQSMTVARIQNMNRIALTDQLYMFSEQLFTEIKNGGTIDYEEYWNRKNFDTTILSWSYQYPSGVGNYGPINPTNKAVLNNVAPAWLWIYLCRSGNGAPVMWTDGCATAQLNHLNLDIAGKRSLFGQYALQFWDYNFNRNADLGDEDNRNGIVGDEDDRNLWNGPETIPTNPVELYLIDKQQNTRTFFRLVYQQDPNTTAPCNGSGSDGCRGTIQILKMRGVDRGINHDATGSGLYDGQIDTWFCQDGWSAGCVYWPAALTEGKLATGSGWEWIDLFPSSINVRKFTLDLYPKKDPWLSAAAPDCTMAWCVSPFIHPYVRFNLELGFSHGARRSIRGENPIISLSTTVSLDDFR